MKKLNNFKWFSLGIVMCMILSLMAFPAMAASFSRTAELVYNNIKITLNGNAVTPKDAGGNAVEPFIIDGTTYLPVRAISNALGLGVDWDGTTNTVKLSDANYIPSGSYTRTNPAPVGSAQTLTVDNYSYKYSATVKIHEVLSGADLSAILGSSVANDTPDPGCELVGIKVSLSLDSISDQDRSIAFDKYLFESYTGSNESLEHKHANLKDGFWFNAKLYKGGNAEGYIIMQRKIGDSGAKIVFGANSDGTGGAWFSIA